MEAFAQANQEAILAWNTVLFDKFVRFRTVVTAGLAIHGDTALRKHPPKQGARALDIGCGFGDTTLTLARLVGPSGIAMGFDPADRFIEEARLEASRAGLSKVRFEIGDVQTAQFDEQFDYAFSRFGVMFFASPVAAFRNLRRAMRPGAELCMVVWRRKEDNQWLHRAELLVEQMVKHPEDSDEPTCGPGPFSMASADLVTSQLLSAGYQEISLERLDAEICIGRDIEEAVAFAMALGPAGEILRLAGAEAERRRPEVEAALGGMLAEYRRSDGVFAPSSTWIVTARAAG
jgi:ubiquinone/menaquinone biosynthesis C-methylase UbiE